jgi:hypothetical protein
MRNLIAVAVVLGLFTVAQAHSVLVYVEGAEARLVFSDTAAPDPSIFPSRAEKTAMVARDADGKETKLSMEKGEGNFLRAKLPQGTVVAFGTTEAGVTQRGDNPAMLSWYYPKTVVGDPFQPKAVAGRSVALEIVPVKDGNTIRFRVVSDGKPMNDADVSVGIHGKDEAKPEASKTDKDGLTPGFSEKGRYCVVVRRIENKAGEFDGKKHSAIRHTATLVCDFQGAAK